MTRFSSFNIVTAASTATLVALGACTRGAAEKPVAEPPTIVGAENIIVAGRGSVTDGPTISGSLTAEQAATVRAQVSGSVLSTSVEAGQRVSRGQSMGRIDAAGIEDALLSSKSGLTSAQSSYDLAKRNFDRTQALLKAGAIAPRDFETSQQSLTAAQAALEDARSRLAMAQKNFDNTRITAPFSGIVSERSVSAGDVVQPGAALFTVIEPSSMRLEASVPAERISELKIGTPVNFSVNGYANEDFVGKVTRINPAADPTTRQVRILAEIPNSGNKLVAGLFAQGRIASRTHKDVIVVPISAIDFRNQTPAAIKVQGGQVARTDVKLGMRDPAAETVEVVSGVAVGDTLLVSAAQGITPGTVVKVQPPPADRARQ